jgi:Subtilase family
MKFKLSGFFFLLVLLTPSVMAQKTYFIKYKDNVPKIEIENKIASNSFLPPNSNFSINANVKSVNHLAKGLANDSEILGRIIKINFDKDVDETSFLNLQNIDPSIEYIEPSHSYQMDFVPNDSLVDQQWALSKIQAFNAWDVTTGSDTVLLGIIDTGIDYLHPDLKNKLWQNPGEIGTDNQGRDKRTNGIDDDNNGFIDDYRGWDFTDRVGFPFDSSGGDYLDWDNDPLDEHGHGTYIAGIAGAEVNNVSGIAGVAPNIKIVNLRAFDPGGYGEEDDVASAILYAVKMKIKVLNMSFGDNSFSYVLRDVIRYAYSQNVVLVGSSGNSGSPDPHYPSGYSEVICVGNSTIEDFVAGSSNYGSTLDLVAPGTNILTTRRNGGYSLISGTSAATPHVAATAALILSLQNFTNEEVKQIIKSTTDDIEEPGWDLRSGAGRLNTFHAVSVIAPSVIKINHPLQDFATLDNQMIINATVLSPLFSNYNLSYGYGLNPDNWISLIENGLNQFSNDSIYTLQLSTLPDSVYCLRLEVQLTNGRTLEERTNFYINRTPPVVDIAALSIALYGDKATVLAAIRTDEPCIAKMYYREYGQSQFNYVTLDGFTTNNEFVKNLHYGFIPTQLVNQGSLYEVYFEAENLVGLTTTLDNNGQFYALPANFDAEISAETKLPFTLPAGSIYPDAVDLTTPEQTEVFIRENTDSRNSTLYNFNNDHFDLVDTLTERIIKDFGDFNGNGLKDVLAYFVRDGFIYEQDANGSSNLIQKFTNPSGDFWPVMAKDIDGDGVTEVLAVTSDTSMKVYKVNPDLSLSGNPVSLNNFTDKKYGPNILDSPNAVIADLNGDGRKELWAMDVGGDIYSYEIFGADDYREGSVIESGYYGSTAFLAAGDYNGDGVDELAVLIHSIDPIDIAPFYKLLIFNLLGNNFNVLYENTFIDAATEFNSSFQQAENSLRFVDLNQDGTDELILFMYPYSYILSNNFGSDEFIYYKENINSNSVFVGDLNNNGVPEVAFPTSDEIGFYEFSISNRTSTPRNLSGFSVDSTLVKLNWQGNVNQFYIFKGNSAENLNLVDSVFSETEYFDQNVVKGGTYFYAIKAYDLFKQEPLSNFSNIIEVYSHQPAVISSQPVSTLRTVNVTFSEKMNNTIENLEGFEVLNVGYPNSISPASQYSYLLSFNNDLPTGTNQLVVQNIRDIYGSPIQTDTVSFEVIPVVNPQQFFISSFEILNAYEIKIVFNYAVDEATATDPDNYVFTPDNKVTSARVDGNDNKIVYLNLKGQKPIGSVGREYVLRLKNVRSSAQTGNLIINDGAGSYIVLSTYAKDLSDVYVYPNPASSSTGNGTATFANLPQRVKIIIWSLNGKKIRELLEDNGDGGVTFDLKDERGEFLPSGVYVFRAVMLDDHDNEGQEKLGKFAVVR